MRENMCGGQVLCGYVALMTVYLPPRCIVRRASCGFMYRVASVLVLVWSFTDFTTMF